MFARIVQRLAAAGHRVMQTLRRSLRVATKPAATPLLSGTLADLARRKPALVLENALLRQQLVILQRSVRRPRYTCAGWLGHPAACERPLTAVASLGLDCSNAPRCVPSLHQDDKEQL